MLWQEISCESVLRRNGFFFVVLISFVLVDTCSFKIGKKFGSVQKIWQLFQIGGYTYSTNTDFLLKQTNKGVEWIRPNTEYCALNFLLCFVHYVQLDKSTSSELVREWLRWANVKPWANICCCLFIFCIIFIRCCWNFFNIWWGKLLIAHLQHMVNKGFVLLWVHGWWLVQQIANGIEFGVNGR